MPDQRSLLDQLEDVVLLADRYGHYDAADYLRAHIKRVVGFTPPVRRMPNASITTTPDPYRREPLSGRSRSGPAGAHDVPWDVEAPFKTQHEER